MERFDSSFYNANRCEFLNMLPDNCVAFFFSGESSKISQDMNAPFLVDRNFYYLTGLEDEDLILMIYKNEPNNEFVLFAPEKNEMKERWFGKRKDFDTLRELSGISDIKTISEFDDYMCDIINADCQLAFDFNSIMDVVRKYLSRTDISNRIFDASKILCQMRMIKKPCEIEAIREATRVTEDSLFEVKKIIKEGISEKEIHSRLEYNLHSRGVGVLAFETITAIGDNSFYLHYGTPDINKKMRRGDIIQFDVGARVNGYCADISRAYYLKSFGESNTNDKVIKVHEIVRKLRHLVFDRCWVGKTFEQLNDEVREECAKWLVENKLIPENYTKEDVSKYYWHGTGHHLGLNVHDVSEKVVLKENMILAIEPGLYIKEWNVGFRIEDDILLCQDKTEILSSGDDSLEDFIL